MMIWAAVDVLEGRAVQLRGGDPGTARYVQDPVEAACRWAREGADGLHLIDLDAALGRGDNRSVMEDLLGSTGVPEQVGGGVRDSVSVERWLEMGADRVIVGTRGVEDPGWLRDMAAAFPNRIVLALDAHGEDVAVAGWTRGSGRTLLDVAQEADGLGLAAFLHTDVGMEGSMRGFAPGPVRTLCATVRTPVLVSGGLRSEGDVRMAYRSGAAGVVLGTALYAGTVRLSDLLRRGAS